MKNIFLLFLFINIFNQLNAQYSEIKSNTNNQNQPGNFSDFNISYNKYQFDNGLILILSEDHSDPVVNINFTWKISSANDYNDRTGISNLINHLLYEENANVYGNQFDEILKSLGTESSLHIDKDRTIYSVNAEKGLLDYVLWTESQRIGKFIETLDDVKLSSAKEVILKKIVEDYNTDENYISKRETDKGLYAFGHPYSWQTYGVDFHYESMWLQDVKKFFADWYGPNNLIITISGDISKERVLKSISKYYGSMTPSPKESKSVGELIDMLMTGDHAHLMEDRYLTVESNVSDPVLTISFITEPKYQSFHVFFDLSIDLFIEKVMSSIFIIPPHILFELVLC